jgi:hypothetical protein
MRGVSFLQFLLSRERDLERYAKKLHGQPHFRKLELEVYPDAYMPTRLAGLRRLEERKAQARKTIESSQLLSDSE